MRRLSLQAFAACLSFVAVVAVWMTLAPAGLGGGVSFLSVSGASMQPSLASGDLVLTRPASRYEVGQVVAYRDPSLRRVVLHRVVGREGSRLVTRGDANDFRDPRTPSQAEILGAQFAHVPRLGAVSDTLRTPWTAALILGAAVLLPGRTRRRRSGHRDRPTPGTPNPPQRTARPPKTGDAGRLRVVAALLGAGCLVAALGLYALSRPTTAVVSLPGDREHVTFAYTAPATPGAAHPDGVATTGEAVFRSLSDRVLVTMHYTRDRPARNRMKATLGLAISDGLGWSRTIPLAPATEIDGTTMNLHGVIDLRRVTAITRGFETESRTDPPAYDLTVVARVGAAAPGRLGAAFAPELTFRLDAERLTLEPTADGGSPRLATSRVNRVSRQEPTTIGAGPLGISVATARALGGLGAEALFGAALFIGLPLLVRLRRSPDAWIRARWSNRLVEVEALPPAATVVAVNRFTDLLVVADDQDAPVLACGPRFAVHSGTAAYVHEATSGIATPQPDAV